MHTSPTGRAHYCHLLFNIPQNGTQYFPNGIYFLMKWDSVNLWAITMPRKALY